MYICHPSSPKSTMWHGESFSLFGYDLYFGTKYMYIDFLEVYEKTQKRKCRLSFGIEYIKGTFNRNIGASTCNCKRHSCRYAQ